jgi:hypothetical protein
MGCNNPLLLWITLWASGLWLPPKPENQGLRINCLILRQEKDLEKQQIQKEKTKAHLEQFGIKPEILKIILHYKKKKLLRYLLMQQQLTKDQILAIWHKKYAHKHAQNPILEKILQDCDNRERKKQQELAILAQKQQEENEQRKLILLAGEKQSPYSR